MGSGPWPRGPSRCSSRWPGWCGAGRSTSTRSSGRWPRRGRRPWRWSSTVMATEPDLLRGVEWECASTPPGEAAEPEALWKLPLRWVPATVPGTAAGAWRDAGLPELTSAELDGSDWWFRCRFGGASGPSTAGARRARLGPRARRPGHRRRRLAERPPPAALRVDVRPGPPVPRRRCPTTTSS